MLLSGWLAGFHPGEDSNAEVASIARLHRFPMWLHQIGKETSKSGKGPSHEESFNSPRRWRGRLDSGRSTRPEKESRKIRLSIELHAWDNKFQEDC